MLHVYNICIKFIIIVLAHSRNEISSSLIHLFLTKNAANADNNFIKFSPNTVDFFALMSEGRGVGGRRELYAKRITSV